LLVELKSVEDTSWLQLFIKNSRYPLVSATHFALACTASTTMGTPSSEVTVLICRVP